MYSSIRIILFSIAGLMALTLFPQFHISNADSVSEKPDPSLEIFRTGKALYQKQCAVCHGEIGLADGKAAYLLYPKPRDFTRNEFRLISTTQMKAMDEDLFKSITRGMSGSSMPSWEHLSALDRWALVYYVRFLAEYQGFVKAGKIQEGQTNPPWEIIQQMIQKDIDPKTIIQVSPEVPVSPEGIERGKALFVKACASCHGPLGKGDGLQKMQDSLGYPLKPRDLTAGIFKASSSAEDLYYRIVAGLPGSPMPSYNGVLSEDQIWDLIHYVQTLPQSGAEERSHLRRVDITAQGVKVELDLNPLSDQWSAVQSVFVPLTPLWWRDDRVEGVEVKALYDARELAILLAWNDSTKDFSTLTPQSFSDGAAIQFSSEADPPSFAMGDSESPVTLWHWKASWQEDLKEWQDIEAQYPHTATDYYESQKNYQYGSPFETKDSKTKFHDPHFITGWGAGNPLSNPAPIVASEEARAQGAGTLTTMRPRIEKVDAKGVWSDGKWHVIFYRPLLVSDNERLQFEPGKPVNIAIAIWDGASGDRNGQKMVSIWGKLQLEEK